MSHRLRTLIASGAALATAALSLTVAGAAPASAAGPARPFPAHVTYQVGVMPSASQASRDAAVQKQYDSWKANYLVHGCASNEYYISTKGDGDATHNGPVSEGQGYGMNIIPLMAGYDPGAQSEFNGLWQLVKDHRDQYGMMQWQLDGLTCTYYSGGTPDGATDGDLDIGYGLILADKQWGGYTTDAKTWLADFYAHNVAPDGHLKCEDDGPSTDTRPSDHMLDHLRAFAAYDTAHDWNKVITRTEAVISQFTHTYSPTTGLLSDFVVHADTAGPQPAPAAYQENQPDNIVGYNSIRVPWHLGTDALLHGSSTAATSYTTAKLESACLKRESGGNPQKVYPHTKLDCTPYSTTDVAEEAGDSVGPAAMAAGDQAWTDAIWNQLATNPFGDGYFGETIKTLVYLVMAGDYWNPEATSAPSNDFSLTTSPTAGSVTAGAAATATVSTAVSSGSAQSVVLTVSGAPTGAGASVTPASVTAGGSATLTVTTSASTPAGSYPITVTGAAASGSHTAVYTLTIGGDGSTAVVNGGFETGDFTGWTRSGTTSITSSAHIGSHAALLGSANPTNGDSTVSQTFTAPAGSNAVSLWYNVNCPDDVAYDWATATLKDNTTGTTATLLAKTCTLGQGWRQGSGALTPGHSYTLTLVSHDENNPGDATDTTYDDVTVS